MQLRVRVFEQVSLWVGASFWVAQRFTAAIQALNSDGFSRWGTVSSANPGLAELYEYSSGIETKRLCTGLR
jgi:hypothetical protein